MSWRNLVIANPTALSCKQQSLLCRQEVNEDLLIHWKICQHYFGYTASVANSGFALSLGEKRHCFNQL